MEIDLVQDSDILQEATDLESNFYTQGYSEGYDHGRLHGLFEGREIGKEKGYELWEEVGYYEGWAGFYLGQLGVGDGVGEPRGKDARVLKHAKVLLDLIQTFPRTNPTPRTNPNKPPPQSTLRESQESQEVQEVQEVQETQIESESEVDLGALLSNIRARYKLLCTSLGVRPRLVAVPGTSNSQSNGDGEESSSNGAGMGTGMVVEGIEGPMKGVDTTKLRF